MSEQLFRQVVETDGHEGHWFSYVPIGRRITFCHECSNFIVLDGRERDLVTGKKIPWCRQMAAQVYPDDFCSFGESMEE